MHHLVLQPLQWNTLRDIDAVKPIDASDAECLEELRRVLEKHNRLDRFGVALLHRHFDVADDELLLETTDVSRREHWVRPVKKSFLEQAGLEAQTTVLRFDERGWSQNCGCLRDKHGHTGRHT
jgi:hypothetical protein